MAIGLSIASLVVGAILLYALTFNVSGLQVPVVGLILMIAGAAGLVFGLINYVVQQWRGAQRDKLAAEQRRPPPDDRTRQYRAGEW